MPESQEPSGADRPPVEPAPKRARRHRRKPLLVRYWWAVPLAIFVMVAPSIWRWAFTPRASYDPLPGYLTDSARVEEEYRTFTGKSSDPAAVAQFDRAAELMRAGSYSNATVVLEAAAKQLPVPAVFNDLGVLYFKLKDGPHALRAFRDALARDHDYAATRANLKSMNLPGGMDPGSNELEPNNENTQANAVWMDRPVQGTITPSLGDVDCFWFITPRPPRDRISIAVINQSATLIPRLHIYDEAGNLVTGLKEAPSAGANVRFDFSPPPNTLYYVQVDGVSSSSGPYTLTVNALHAYDVYEPNDTIMNATRITPGQMVDANIMDGDDTDHYSFLSPVSGQVNIDVISQSAVLQLGLGTFASDLHSTGFAPDLKAAGDPIHHRMEVVANQVYYLEVFSKNDTAGPYTLIVK